MPQTLAHHHWELGATRTDCRVRLWPSGHWASFRLRRSRQRVAPLTASEYTQSRNYLLSHDALDAVERQTLRDRLYGFINSQEKSQTPKKPVLGHKYRLTPYMKKMILSAGKVLEEEAGRDNLAMLTCTMPYSEREAVIAYLQGWKEIQRRFIQELTRELQRAGLSGDNAWVTELQEKRGDRVGYPCPHLHILFQGRRRGWGHWAVSKEWCRDAWWRVVTAVTGYDFDPIAATRVEKVRGNAAGYLAKYLTKGGDVAKKWKGTEWEKLLPTAYGRTNHALSSKVKKLIRYLHGEGARSFHIDKQQLQEEGILAITFERYGCTAGFTLDVDRLDEFLAYYQAMPDDCVDPPSVMIV